MTVSFFPCVFIYTHTYVRVSTQWVIYGHNQIYSSGYIFYLEYIYEYSIFLIFINDII